MAYKEKYPLDITPQGDTVPESIQKNRNEILNIAQNMELKAGGGSSGGGLRNRLLSGKVSNGEFSFLTGDNLSVMIDGSQTPVLLSFADGFNDFGAVDYIATINRRQSAWSLPANSTSYLYVERSASGGLTYGSTTLEPLRQSNAPEAATDKMYYNTTSEKMYVYTGTYWKNTLRVVVAIAVTDATRVKSIKYYDPNVNTATDAVIGKRTVDGKDYLITDILNQMAEAIKKIAGDENFTNNPTRTLKAITDIINGLGETYYKKTDTVASAKQATNATNANYANVAGTANQLSDGDKTINGGLIVTNGVIPQTGLDWNDRYNKKVVFCEMSKGDSGVPQNGIIISYGGTVNWRGCLFISDNGTDGVWYGGNTNGNGTGWHKIYGDGQMSRILFNNNTELWVE